MGIKRGVSFYSYQEEIFDQVMTLEDCIATSASFGAYGVEILGEQVLPNFPNITDEFAEQWFQWMDKYKTTPTCYDAFLDTKLYKNRLLTEQECVDQMVRDIKIASKLGFKSLRTLVTTPLNVIEQSLPYAEQYDVKIGIEIHAPWSLKSEWMSSFMAFIQRTGTKHFGFIPDMGIFTKKLISVAQARYVRAGATPSIVDYIAQEFEKRTDKQVVKEAVIGMGGNPLDQELAEWAYGNTFDHPEWLKDIIPYIVHIHGKFYEMTEDCVEPNLAYEEVVQVLADAGYDGYMSSEYEGNRHIHDAFEVDSREQVRRHQLMLARLIG
jgi:sugar phosphate isomerase/epimerase